MRDESRRRRRDQGAARIVDPGALELRRTKSADFFITHGNYAQTRYHLADRINTQTVKDLKLVWTFQLDLTESIQGAPEEPTWGDIVATDYNTGKIRWKVKKPLPMFGGILATAGGLIFTGEGSGEFGAYDSATGKELWSYKTDAGVNAPASTYMLDGKQYVVVGAGGNTQLDFKRGNKYYVFAY